jgi:hypothetical protein
MNFTFQNDSSSAVALIKVFNHQRPFIVFGVEEKITKWTQKVKHGEIDLFPSGTLLTGAKSARSLLLFSGCACVWFLVRGE